MDDATEKPLEVGDLLYIVTIGRFGGQATLSLKWSEVIKAHTKRVVVRWTSTGWVSEEHTTREKLARVARTKRDAVRILLKALEAQEQVLQRKLANVRAEALWAQGLLEGDAPRQAPR